MNNTSYTCCCCRADKTGFGNNPAPLVLTDGARCCDDCNKVVIMIRMMGNIATPTEGVHAADANKCLICNKTYKNVLLHIIKKHDKVKCNGCGLFYEKNLMINELGGAHVGKYNNHSLCCNCWT